MRPTGLLARRNDEEWPVYCEGVTYPAATRAIEALQKLGIVRAITGRSRARVLAYDAYFAILNEGA